MARRSITDFPDEAEKGLTKKCFEEYPKWYRQTFAQRFLRVLLPVWLTRRLQKYKPEIFEPPPVPPIRPIPPTPPGPPIPPTPPGPPPVPPGLPIPPTPPGPPAWQILLAQLRRRDFERFGGRGLERMTEQEREDWLMSVQGTKRGKYVKRVKPRLPVHPSIRPPSARPPWPPEPHPPWPPEPGPPHRGGPGEYKKTTEVIIESSTADGWVENDGTTWNTVRSAVTGKLVDDNDEKYLKSAAVLHYSPDFYIYRSFFYFDLSVIPAGSIIDYATFNLQSYIAYSGNITIQEGTQADPLTTADFGSFEDTVFADVIFHSGNNYISMNAAGRAYLEAQFGSMAKLCFRDSDYDVSGIQPPNNTSWKDSCYYAETIEEKRPRLTIIYK